MDGGFQWQAVIGPHVNKGGLEGPTLPVERLAWFGAGRLAGQECTLFSGALSAFYSGSPPLRQRWAVGGERKKRKVRGRRRI